MIAKKILAAEVPALIVSLGLGAIFGFFLGMHKGAFLFSFVFALLQPFTLSPFFKKWKSGR